MDEQFLQAVSFPTPLIWICISLFISLLCALVCRRLTQRQQYLINSTRWVLLPYFGLLLGALSPRLLGLTEINWISSLSLGTGLIGLTAVLIVLVQTTTPQRTTRQQALGTKTPISLAESVVSAGAEQFHWSFLRGALWESLLRIGYSSTTAAYTGFWLSGLIAAVEILFHKRDAMSRLVSLLTLITTSILFFFTHNFWLCWLLHFVTTAMLQQTILKETSA